LFRMASKKKITRKKKIKKVLEKSGNKPEERTLRAIEVGKVDQKCE